MGFFNKILKGLGFEDDEEEVAPKPKKKEIKIQQKNDVTASYNLNKIEKQEKHAENKSVQNIEVENKQTSPFEIVKVASQVEVQAVVNKLKQGQTVFVSLQALSSADYARSLDFLSGAVYALGLSLQKVEDKMFLII